MKAVLRRKFIALSAMVKKLERSYSNHLIAHLRAIEQKEANSPMRSRRQEITQIETKKTIQRINKTKAGSLIESTR